MFDAQHFCKITLNGKNKIGHFINKCYMPSSLTKKEITNFSHYKKSRLL